MSPFPPVKTSRTLNISNWKNEHGYTVEMT